MVRIAIACATVLVSAVPASGTDRVRVSLSSRPAAVTVGRAWTAALTVRPASFRGAVRLTATGHGRLRVRANGAHGSYRARLVFPAVGQWTLTARAGAFTSRLGTMVVRKRAPIPVTFTWPTSIDLQPDGSLLVVENGAGRVVRVQPATGRVSLVASGLAKPYAVAQSSGGAIYLSNANALQRLDAGTPVTIATAAADIGPIAVAPNGDVYYATQSQVFEFAGGSPRLIASHLDPPHGIAVDGGGDLLVSDTGNDRVLRIDPQTGRTTTLISTGEPAGVDVGADGSIYLVEAATLRVARYSSAGARLGNVGPTFNDPYDLAVARDGTVYVVDTALKGTIRRIAPDGSVSTIGR
jgi:streptogramin lyase